jgi:hypothetical protein
MDFKDYLKDFRISIVTIIWIIFLLTLYYYFAIAKVETAVVRNTADYLIINVISVIRPVIAGLDEDTRKSLKFQISSTPAPTPPPKDEPLFSGSYGSMRVIMLVTAILLVINLVYNIIIFSKAGLVLFVVAMLTGGIITIIELVFVEIVTPSFIFVDFNKTIRNLVKITHAKFNCASVIATDEKCKSACPNTFKTCKAVPDITRYCKDFKGVDVCLDKPNGLKDGNCTSNKFWCDA